LLRGAYRSLYQRLEGCRCCQHIKQLTFLYPICHNKQREIARGFKSKSRPDFACCAGAIDGMLLWIKRPSEEKCEIATSCGSTKFFCSCKHKFGLNQGHFLDVSIGHPASTSDYLSFSTSAFREKLEKEGFLTAGLCIFGNNAYVNCSYMATPYKNVGSGSKDNYNHYHSQVCWILVLVVFLIKILTSYYSLSIFKL
jgi:hypothetical protein